MDTTGVITGVEWDCLVIGTGIGGSTLGHALAKAGHRVLFLEKGTSPRKTSMLTGVSPEETIGSGVPLADAHRDVLRRGGRYSERYTDRTKGTGASFFPLMGSGAGGSSALYGAVLERFQPLDFTPRSAHPHAAGSTIPDEWPISYTELLPYYQRAEALYSVKPTSLGPVGQQLDARLRALGLSPYPLPVATRSVDGCRNCQGMLCARECKIDSYQACLKPAIEHHGATLAEDCEVLAVTSDAHRVSGVRGRIGGRDVRIAAKTLVLAAGAFETPRLLLNSSSPHWPNGLANGSGMVGRNLMRHPIDLYVMKTPLTTPTWGKEIGIADFYNTPNGKFGGVHGMGPMPVASSLAELVRHPAMRLATPILRRVLNTFAGRFVFVSFLEDLPFAENRVHGGPTTSFEYRLHPYDEGRLREFRRLLRSRLGPSTRLTQAHINERVFHACGTCRFGAEPAASVLDRHNRAHDLENLYVVDASFMPTSGGTAPSLTIAANALRVADHLLGLAPAR